MFFPKKPDEDWYWPVEILYTLAFLTLVDQSLQWSFWLQFYDESDDDEDRFILHWCCIGVRAGGARGAAAPQILGNSDFLASKRKFGQSLFLKTSPCLFNYFEDLNINLKSA